MTSVRKATKKRVDTARSEFVGFKLDKATVRRLDAAALTQGASRSFIIRQLLTAALTNHDAKPEH
jgi:predicted transcriptional regulator